MLVLNFSTASAAATTVSMTNNNDVNVDVYAIFINILNALVSF